MFASLRTACLGLALAVTAAALPAQAEDGVWKVGTGYVVRFENLDLSEPADRQVLLAQIERAAAKACEGQLPNKRRACAVEAIATATKGFSPGLRASLDVARFERDGQMQAQR